MSGRDLAGRSAFLVGAMVMACSPAQAQGPEYGAPDPVIRLFLAPFGQTGPGGPLPGLALFTQRLIQLELLANPAVRAVETDLPVSCTRPPPVPGGGGSAGAASPEAAPFYLLEGSVAPSSAEFLLDIELIRCDSAGDTRLFQESLSVSWENAVVELVSISERISDILREEVPSTTVAVRGFRVLGDGGAPGGDIGRRLRRRVDEAIEEIDEFDVVESSGNVALEGQLAFGPGTRVEAGFHFTGLGGGGVPPLRVEGRTAELDSFFTRVVDEVVPAIYRVRYLEQAGPGAAEPDLDRALAVAGDALCLAPAARPCTPRPQDAVVVLQAVARDERGSAQAGIRRHELLGRAYLLMRRGKDAAESLSRALELAERAAGGAEALDRSPAGVPLLNLAARAYRSVGNFQASAEFSGRSLRADPAQPDIVRLHAEALRFTGRRLEALAAVASARRVNPRDDSLVRLLFDHVSGLRPSDLVRAAPVVDEVCDVSIRRRCAERLVALGDTFYAGGAFPAGAAALRLALHLGVAPPERAEVLALTAAAFLGAFRSSVDEAGRRIEQPIAFEPDSALRYLDLAEGEARRGGGAPALLEWLARLRSHYWRARREYGRARDQAELAHRINPSPESRLLLAQLLVMEAQDADDFRAPVPSTRARELYQRAARDLTGLARGGQVEAYWYLRDINHRLGQDRETRATLERLLRVNPADEEAGRVLRFVCTEYLHDFPCAYRLARAAYERGDLREPGDYLEVAEVAVLAGEHAFAQQVLAESLRMGAGPCMLAVLWLYRLWSSAATGAEAEIGPAFSAWSSAVGEHRRTGAESCWIFDGARWHLAANEGSHDELIFGMIDAMLNPDLPLPGGPR